MSEIDTKRVRETAEDLVDVLSVYEAELVRLERETPALARLREAIGAALVEAYWNLDSGAESYRAAARSRH
jgi:hypothetical protein